MDQNGDGTIDKKELFDAFKLILTKQNTQPPPPPPPPYNFPYGYNPYQGPYPYGYHPQTMGGNPNMMYNNQYPNQMNPGFYGGGMQGSAMYGGGWSKRRQ